MKYTIWKSYGMHSIEEIKDYEETAMQCFLNNEFTEEEITQEAITDRIYEDLEDTFEDECYNLNKKLEGNILAIANMGLWNGRKTGYKVLSNNLQEILTSSIGCNEKEIYFDGFNIKAKGHHHDGTNYIEFRMIRPNRNINKLLDKIYMNQPITRNEINYYTKSLRKEIKAIYSI